MKNLYAMYLLLKRSTSFPRFAMISIAICGLYLIIFIGLPTIILSLIILGGDEDVVPLSQETSEFGFFMLIPSTAAVFCHLYEVLKEEYDRKKRGEEE